MQIDHSTDPSVWDNTEAVTIVSAAQGTQTKVAAALRRAPQYVEQAPSSGVYVAARLGWMLPNNQLANYAPQPGDVLVDASNTDWVLLSTQRQGQGQAWKLDTIDLILAYGLYDTLMVRRATNTQDAAGSRVPTFATLHQGIPARFQPQTADQLDERGKRFTGQAFLVYSAMELTDLRIEDQLIDQAGNVYEVHGWHNPLRLDELFTVDCELLG